MILQAHTLWFSVVACSSYITRTIPSTQILGIGFVPKVCRSTTSLGDDDSLYTQFGSTTDGVIEPKAIHATTCGIANRMCHYNMMPLLLLFRCFLLTGSLNM
jgi:hypothetical protein